MGDPWDLPRLTPTNFLFGCSFHGLVALEACARPASKPASGPPSSLQSFCFGKSMLSLLAMLEHAFSINRNTAFSHRPAPTRGRCTVTFSESSLMVPAGKEFVTFSTAFGISSKEEITQSLMHRQIDKQYMELRFQHDAKVNQNNGKYNIQLTSTKQTSTWKFAMFSWACTCTYACMIVQWLAGFPEVTGFKMLTKFILDIILFLDGIPCLENHQLVLRK